jgi:hypothetical protein
METTEVERRGVNRVSTGWVACVCVSVSDGGVSVGVKEGRSVSGACDVLDLLTSRPAHSVSPLLPCNQRVVAQPNQGD